MSTRARYRQSYQSGLSEFKEDKEEGKRVKKRGKYESRENCQEKKGFFKFWAFLFLWGGGGGFRLALNQLDPNLIIFFLIRIRPKYLDLQRRLHSNSALPVSHKSSD